MLKYIFLVTFACASAKFRFDNYTLYKILPENERHISLLRGLQEDARFDFWTDPSPLLNFVSVLSSPGYKHELENFLNENDIQFTISLPDVQDAISKEKIGSYVRSEPNSMRWDTYYKNEDINNWLDSLATAYPNIVTVIVGGRTFEGREIKGLKISHGSGRRAIFIESGIHAREWIAPATTNYIINELLTSNDADTMAAARDYDWYIFPVTNPDGYIWSHEQFRMWRKNRRPITADAVGVDLNRNWNSNWLVHGSSLDPSTDNYAGPGPFSEPESRSLSEYIRGINNIDLYLSMHSFSELLLLPFGNSTGQYAYYLDALNIGRRAMGALSVRHGTQYVTGSIAEAIYLATGGSIDWVKSHLNVPLVYCYELRDRGEYGFLLPPEQILDNSQEVMDSLLEIIHQAKRFGYMDSGSDII
ncbi:zinc carboxypeptidase-like [Leptidea sinapis]|uniref:zinc carboxypeptidase-like n=1 Tax=Leptidea sinapis TaxID=189913 RepID=UPI00213C3B14|nr:zinc carboxypeptidase-like [Leptidea sinapis]